MRNRLALPRFAALLIVALLAGCAGNRLPEKAADTAGAPGQAILPPDAASQAMPQAAPPAVSSAAAMPANPEVSIFFSPGASAIASAERRKLKPLASRLQADRRQTVTLVGHANDNGSRSFNLAVADARIGAVASALKKLGVAAYQIRKRVLGDEQVPADCRASACRKAMRRVDFLFSGPATAN